MVQRIFIISGALMGWFALAAQLYLIIINRVMSVLATVVQYFSFFTIITNLLVALCFTVLWLQPQQGSLKLFYKPKLQSALAVYIVVVAVVYNVILRFIWEPHGLQMWVDELLHSVIPVVFVLYWFLFTDKKDLQWKDAFLWMAYPLTYSAYILIRGFFTDLYPYPFIDVTDLGYSQVLINSLLLYLFFLLLSLILVAAGKAISRKQ
jgi:hypothetical protein